MNSFCDQLGWHRVRCTKDGSADCLSDFGKGELVEAGLGNKEDEGDETGVSFRGDASKGMAGDEVA